MSIKSNKKLSKQTLNILLAAVFVLGSQITHSYSPNTYIQQRADYQEALQQLSQGNLTSFNNTVNSLKNYPLYPYLEYETLNLRSKHLPIKKIDAFIQKYDGEPIAQRMRVKLLNKLIKKHEWQKYIDNWDPNIRSARLNCWYLRSQYRVGLKQESLSAVQPLWLQAKSQPKACDPLFKEWIEAGYLTQKVAWQRFEMAMNANKTRLASYIARKLLKDDFKTLGQEYLKVHRKPHKLSNYSRNKTFSSYPNKVKKIIIHGLKRLARKNAEKAQQLWSEYEFKRSFSDSEKLAITQAIAIGSAINHTGSIDASQLDKFSEVPANALEQRIRIALRESDWGSVFYLIQLLPEETQQSARWQYWLARTIELQQLNDEGLPAPKEIYKTLAKTRSYYGFLSADHVKANYSMQDQPAAIPEGSLERLSQNKHMIRAMELFALGQVDNARREWRFAARTIDSTLLLASGKLAEEFGWYEKAIRSYIKARYWDDVKTRFPLAYKSKMLSASKDQELDTSWLYAIARQESAFSPDARSHAGAMGLMQLMPSTAKQTARQIGLSFKRKDLLKPETNIHLGSNYLKGLLKQFNGNRILATTAYNAGPHRVKKWLKKSKSNLPFDVWIETIPFKETRSYVQNVLAFSVIYDYRMDQQSQLVTSIESEQLL